MQNGKLCITPRGQFAYNLPIEEDKYLVLTTGEGRDNWLGGDMVLAFDSSGEEVLDFLAMESQEIVHTLAME